MKITIYYTFNNFEFNYLLDYEKLFKHLTLNEYYKILLREYNDAVSIILDSFDIHDSIINYNNSAVNKWAEKKKQASNAIKLESLEGKFDWGSVCEAYLQDDFLNYKEAYNTKKHIFTNKEIFQNFCLQNLIILQRKLSTDLNYIKNFVERKIIESGATAIARKQVKKLTNPKKLALLQTLGFFDLSILKNLSEDIQNEIVALLLDADKKEFVYKNRLNLNSKNPSYQIDKYTAFQYLEEMEKMLNEM